MALEHIAFCSGGKDSVATVILAKENDEPLDAVFGGSEPPPYDKNIRVGTGVPDGPLRRSPYKDIIRKEKNDDSIT